MKKLLDAIQKPILDFLENTHELIRVIGSEFEAQRKVNSGLADVAREISEVTTQNARKLEDIEKRLGEIEKVVNSNSHISEEDI